MTSLVRMAIIHRLMTASIEVNSTVTVWKSIGKHGPHSFLECRVLREKGKSLFYLFPLYLVGLTMAHLIAEVAQRYHYSGNFCLAVLAAYGVYRVGLGSLRQARAVRNGSEVSP